MIRLTLVFLIFLSSDLCFADKFKAFLQPGEKMYGTITVNPFSSPGARSANYLVRLNPDGTLDATFGAQGRVDVNFIPDPMFMLTPDFLVQDSGKIVVGSAACRQASGSTECTQYLARYTDAGALDSAFGDPATPGRVTFVTHSSYVNPPAVFVQGRKLVVARAIYQPNGQQTTELRRYTEDGVEDAAFGVGGVADVGTGSLRLVQADGKLLLSRWVTVGTDSKPELERLTAEGMPDASFSGGKILVKEVPYFSSIDQLPDGKLIAAGSAGTPSNISVMRLNQDGSTDASFGTKGVATLPSVYTEASHSLAIAQDGSVFVGASRYLIVGGKYLGTQCEIVKFDPTGAPDPGFGAGGYNIVLFNNGNQESVDGVQVQAGKSGAVVQTRATIGGNYLLSFAKLDAGGNPDPNFGNNGVVAVP